MKKSVKEFSNDWWREVAENSGEFNKPYIIDFKEQLLSEDDLRVIFNSLKNFEDTLGNGGFRVFVEQGRRAEFELEFKKNTWEKSESFAQWMKRIFGNQKFAIILNSVEQFNEDLLQRMAICINPLLENDGVPSGGLDMTFIIGNYGYTPFGIHHDGNDNTILHFHSGTASKEMFMWDPEVYIEKSGDVLPSFDMESLNKYATKFTIQPGQFFNLAPGYYHIGYSPELSTGLTIIFNEINPKNYSTALMTELGNHLYDPLDSGIDSAEGVSEAVTFIAPPYKGVSIEKAIKMADEDYTLSLLSNCGFRRPPLANKLALTDSDNIEIKKPFEIYYKVRKAVTTIFYRKRQLTIPNDKAIVSLIRLLNKGEAHSVKDLKKKFTNKENAPTFTRVLQAFLNSYAVIKKTNNLR